MSENTTQTQDTMHAFLVAWGWFAEHIGLIQAIEAVPLKQKRYRHTPQGKVLEFLVAILAGLRHLQDISDDAHPLVKDRAVAEAWGQAGWADYSGVSRTLSGLSWDEAREITSVLERISEPFVKAELQLLQDHGQRLCLDGDLTGLPVSSTSQTYPNAAYGYMDDEIRLGYQAGLVSLQSPTYGRLWLSVSHHPGDTVSSTQAEGLVLAAERRLDVSSPTRLRVRPHRRTELLQQRIHAFAKQVAPTDQRRVTQERAVAQAEEQLREIQQALQDCAHDLIQIEDDYRMQQRPERPTGRLAQARKRVEVMTKRLLSREKACQDAQRRLDKTRAQLQEQQAQLSILQQRLDRFEKDNAGNPDPVIAEFRLDAGFGTYENIALLIEMGYEVYTKPHSHQVVTYLRKQVDDPCSWKRVGANAELIAWPNMQLKKCPYPLDVALERFYTGQTLKHSALLHFGTDPVTHNLAAWFQHYNGRQTIEIVFTQMTKGCVLACGSRWDHVTDFDRFVVNDDSVNQQFYQLSALGEIELLECRLQAPTEVVDASGELGCVQLLLGLCLQLTQLLREATLRLSNLLPFAFELVPADHLGQVHLEQAGLLALQLRQGGSQGTLAILQCLWEPLTRLGACQFMGDEGWICQ
jgi:hypothetical protein